MNELFIEARLDIICSCALVGNLGNWWSLLESFKGNCIKSFEIWLDADVNIGDVVLELFDFVAVVDVEITVGDDRNEFSIIGYCINSFNELLCSKWWLELSLLIIIWSWNLPVVNTLFILLIFSFFSFKFFLRRILVAEENNEMRDVFCFSLLKMFLLDLLLFVNSSYLTLFDFWLSEGLAQANEEKAKFSFFYLLRFLSPIIAV